MIVRTHFEARLDNIREATIHHLSAWQQTKQTLVCDGCGKEPPDSPVDTEDGTEICSPLDDINQREKQDLRHTLNHAFFELQLPNKHLVLCPSCRDKHLWVAHEPGAWRILRPHFSIVTDSFEASWSINHKTLLARALIIARNNTAWYINLVRKAKKTAFAKWSLQVLENLIKIGIGKKPENTTHPDKFKRIEKEYNLLPTKSVNHEETP